MRSRTQSDPPRNIDAERTVLGAILVDNKAYDSASLLLRHEDFYRPGHALIFAAICSMMERSIAVDLVTLKNELSKSQILDAAGGVEYLAGLVDGVPKIENVLSWSQIIADAALLRRLAVASSAIEESAQGGHSADEAIDKAESLISSLRREGAARGPVPMSSLMGAVARNIERTAALQGMTGVETGFKDLTRLTGGWQKGDLIVLAARPSMGKTSIALQFARMCPTLVISLEMSAEKLMQRMVMAEAGISRNRIAWGLAEDEWERLARATSVVGKLPIWIDDPPAITVDSIARRAKRIPNLGLIVVDYLQLVSPPKNGARESREQQVAAISRGLKRIAKTLDVPVIALAQIVRASEQRKDKRPMLSDLRESGAVEQDADLVAFVYRESVYGQTEDNMHKAELIIAKHRDGATDTVHLAFVREIAKFVDKEIFEGGAPA